MDSHDLEAQLAVYAKQLDDAAPDLDELTPSDAAADTDPHGSVASIGRKRSVPDWAFAAVAAAAVVFLIGSVALFSALRSSSGDPVATAPPTTTSTLDEAVDPPADSPAVLISTAPVIGTESPTEDDLLRFFTLGDVVLSEGELHALLGVEDTDPKMVHATSPDGSTWDVDPVAVEIIGVEDAKQMRATTLVQVEDGSWVGYFDVMRDLGGFGDHQYRYWIYRGTAPDVTGPWTIAPDPVLDADAEGSWDGGWVRNASVLPSDDGWTMFYLGAKAVTDDAGSGQVGVATSRDGIVWEKASEPVFVGDEESRFEDGALNRIQVKRIGDELILTYAGRTGGNRGLATSSDGLTWVRDERNPILTNLEVPRSSIFDTALVDDDGTLRWYVGAGGFSSMAVYELRLDL